MRNNILREDLDAVIEHLKQDDPILTHGANVRAFEEEWSDWLGVKYSVFVNSGASANLLTMAVLKIRHPEGGEVIVPPLTWISDIASVLQNGFTPVFVDIDPQTLAMDAKQVLAKVTTKTRAVFLTHVQGFDGLTDELVAELDRRKIPLIEDVCESFGSEYNNQKLGTFGDISVFSLYFGHHLSTIEGGMITTSSKKIFEYVQRARNHGIMKSLTQRYSNGKPWEYDVVEAGYNYRIDEIRCALGLNQLERLEKLNLKRRQASEYYNSKFQDSKWIQTPKITRDDSCHLYILRIKNHDSVNRDKLFERLLNKGIRTSVHYKPLHEFTLFKQKAKIYGDLEQSKNAYKQIISLPLYPQITKGVQDFVISCISNSMS